MDVHDIDEQPDNEVLFRELAAIEGVPVPQEIITVAQWRNRLRPGARRDVVMYCTDWCPLPSGTRVSEDQSDFVFEVNISAIATLPVETALGQVVMRPHRRSM